MTTNLADSLGKVAAVLAAAGARAYLERNHIAADPVALSECLRSWVSAKLPEALNDAREALACHMDQAAEATFRASMINAGIEAAKEASQPVPA